MRSDSYQSRQSLARWLTVMVAVIMVLGWMFLMVLQWVGTTPEHTNASAKSDEPSLTSQISNIFSNTSKDISRSIQDATSEFSRAQSAQQGQIDFANFVQSRIKTSTP